MRILSPCSSSTAVASVSAWSPSVVTSGVVSAVDKTGYVTSTLCAGGVDAVLLPWLGSFYLELVSSGSGVQIPFLGSLFSVNWGFLLRRQASDPLHPRRRCYGRWPSTGALYAGAFSGSSTCHFLVCH